MKICKNCGSKQSDNAVFCEECGCMEFEGSESSAEELKTDFFESNEILDDEIEEQKEQIASKEVFENKIYDTKIKELKLQLLDDNENIIKTWTLSKLPSYTIGRISSKGSVDIDLSNIEGGEYVSRKHAKIYRDNGKWYFVDIGSKYGSEIISDVSRESLVPKQEYVLKDGDILVLAKKIKIEIEI